MAFVVLCGFVDWDFRIYFTSDQLFPFVFLMFVLFFSVRFIIFSCCFRNENFVARKKCHVDVTC